MSKHEKNDATKPDANPTVDPPKLTVPDGYVLMAAPKGATGGNIQGYAFDVAEGHAAIPESLCHVAVSHGYSYVDR